MRGHFRVRRSALFLIPALPLVVLVALLASGCVVRYTQFSTLPDGTKVFAGKVENYSSVAVLNPLVQVRLIDGNGNDIGEQTTGTCVRSLDSKQGISYFETTIRDPRAVRAQASLIGGSSYNTSGPLPGAVDSVRVSVAEARLSGNTIRVRGSVTFSQYSRPSVALQDLRVCLVVVAAKADNNPEIDAQGPVVRVAHADLGDATTPATRSFDVSVEVPSTSADYHVDAYADALSGGTPSSPAGSLLDIPVTSSP